MRPRLPESGSRLIALVLGNLCAAGVARADDYLTPGAVYGTAEERCVDGSGAVVSTGTVAWESAWRMSQWRLTAASWSTGGWWYTYQWGYGSLKAEWTFGDHHFALEEGDIRSLVSTLAPYDQLSLQHTNEVYAGDTVIDGSWSVKGPDFQGTNPYGSDGGSTRINTETVYDAVVAFTASGPDGACTWTGTIDGYVPVEECAGGVDEDGDGLVDGADPNCQECGDGIVDADEECDDGNRYNDDLCDERCRIEPDSDGDGVNDARDRCDGEDDSIDVDGDMRPDCLPRIHGGAAGGTAEVWCYDANWVETYMGTEVWSVVWDLSTGSLEHYGSTVDSGGTIEEYSQHRGIDAVWVMGEETYAFTEGTLYAMNYDSPRADEDTYYYNHYEPIDAQTTFNGYVEVWDGDFLSGDIYSGALGVELLTAVDQRMQAAISSPGSYCWHSGTIEWFGGEASSDGDGVPDDRDLCPDVDAWAYDRDQDGCIDDSDADGVPDDIDVCPGGDDAADDDGDGAADACDACPGDALNDQDGDGLCTADDACPFDPDDATSQSDLDGDGVCNIDDTCNAGTSGWLGGDEDDALDDDLDGIPDGCDLCLDLDGDAACTTDETCARSGQGGDADADGACDPEDACPLDYLDDSDGDGACDSDDLCPGVDDTPDGDGDGLSDCLDSCPSDPENDGDGDGICEATDNCPAVPNSNQGDGDGDGLGDACETDRDDDGVPDDEDNCPDDPNADQVDADGDGAGDACDADDDGDGVTDATDACVGGAGDDPVLATGCTVAQTCPEGGDWKSNGAYVRCVSGGADALLSAGLITRDEWVALTVAAARSRAGRGR